MTVEAAVSKVVYQGNGVGALFPVPFVFRRGEHVRVVLKGPGGGEGGSGVDGVDIIPAPGEYSVEEAAPGAWNVRYPLSGPPLPAGRRIIIYRATPPRQDLDLENGGAFNAEELEKGLDNLEMQIQEIQEEVERSVKVPVSSEQAPESLLLDIFTARDAAVNSAASAEASQAAAQAAAASAGLGLDMTRAEYEALDEAEKMDGKMRFLIDEQSYPPTHNAVLERDAAQCHPISAISGLAETLENIGGEERHSLLEFFLCWYPFLGLSPSAKPGMVPVNGTLIANAAALYPQAWAYLQTPEGQALCTDEASWQAAHTATWATLADGSQVGWAGVGGCTKYVLDLMQGSIRMPDLRGMYAEASGFASLNVGGVKGDQMREITGRFSTRNTAGAASWLSDGVFEVQALAAYITGATGGDTSPGNYRFRASRVLPTGPSFAPRRWGALACLYLGRPAII